MEEEVFEGVRVRYEAHIVRVETNGALMEHLARPGNGSLALARHIRARYVAVQGAEIEISERSMATEILVHAYLDVLFLRLARWTARPGGLRGRLGAWGARMRQHTQVIDMGEAAVDGNRRVFDVLSHGYWLLRILLGRRA